MPDFVLAEGLASAGATLPRADLGSVPAEVAARECTASVPGATLARPDAGVALGTAVAAIDTVAVGAVAIGATPAVECAPVRRTDAATTAPDADGAIASTIAAAWADATGAAATPHAV